MLDVMAFQQASSAMSMGSQVYTMENTGPVELLPNPDFVFPARPSGDGSSQLPAWNTLNQRRADRNLSLGSVPPFGRTRQTASLLPNFTFNPAGSGPTSPTTPPLSPSLNDPLTPSRGTRHRRGGSEFIGLDQKTGNVSVINTSPIKADSSVPHQAPLHLGPPPGRRHAHRRSGAISCHDLSSILQTRDGHIQTKSDSAPTSPMDLENRSSFSFPAIHDVVAAKFDQPEPKVAEESPQRRPPSRARVGFSERVEYIRPLSIISSETESSMSTIRGHSVSGSFSSMISSENIATSPHRVIRPTLLATVELEDQENVQRPQTALALSPQTTQQPSISFAEPIDRPRTASCISETTSEPKSKRKSFWGNSKQPRINPQSSNDSLTTPESLSGTPPVSPSHRKSLESDQETVKTAVNSSKKPRKVRSWAHSLISRKHKNKKDQRPPTPNNANSVDSESETDESDSTASQTDATAADMDFNFDVDNTVTLITESTTQRPVQPELKLTTDLKRSPSDIMSPVIDLDAALGPFNTPPLASNARDLSARQPPRPRRSMHSLNSAGVALLLGPSHRRTESAPELVPFDLRSKHTHNVMPDVFEEEDEEETADSLERTPRAKPAVDSGLSIKIRETDDAATQELPLTPGFGPSRRKKSEGLVISTDSTPRPSSVYTPKTLSIPRKERSSIEVVEDYEDPRDSKGSEETITPPHTGGKDAELPSHLRFDLPHPHHIMTPDTLSDISASPFFSPSQASLETPRLGTSTSSMNENLIFSFGEPGPEVRTSVDDVPSLTSSRSTMTSPMMSSALPMPPPSSNGRAASIYSTRSLATAEIQEKRRSIASLSRFVGGGFGAEKSKLSIEQRPMSQHTTLEHHMKKPKARSHRLSKLMQFWKGKEGKKMEMNS